MKNKKGISAIVATVLIILITVAAVTILWMTIIPMVGDQLKQGTVCIDAISQITIEDDGYTCYDNTSPEVIKVKVKQGSKRIELAGIQVLTSKDGDSKAYNSSEVDGASSLGINQEKVLTVTGVGDVMPDNVRIAPIVNVGNSQVYCEPSTPIKLRVCGA